MIANPTVAPDTDRFAGFEKRVEFWPAYDETTNSHTTNRGVCDVRIRFLLIGSAGATQFLMGTGWYLPSVGRMGEPTGWDVGYHSPVPRYEGQTAMGDCSALGGKVCYYDGSSLAAEPVLADLIARGEDAVWSVLLDRYNDLFLSSEVEG